MSTKKHDMILTVGKFSPIIKQKAKTALEDMYMDLRLEHPRPELMRDAYLSLNGEWEFEIDNAVVGKYKGYENRISLNDKIIVPFCPESKLSGQNHTDFINSVWYRRDVTLPESWKNKRILLHFEAVDYKTTVFVNGKTAGTHVGGYTPFYFDITALLTEGKNSVCVYAEDNHDASTQVSGKQSHAFHSSGCFYTRTTGIWQSVWLEAVNEARIERYSCLGDAKNSSLSLTVHSTEQAHGSLLTVKASFNGKPVGKTSTVILSRTTAVNVTLSELHLWDIGQGNLYDLEFTLENVGEIVDTLKGYCGIRDIRIKEKSMYLNGRKVFGRFVLDQGFYPDGIYTAPSDQALIDDIKYSMALGFNGARLHQKVFEARFLYHADKLGYMVFDETGNWGLDPSNPVNVYNFLPEWLEEMQRDEMHPSIIGWCPFNETWDFEGRQQNNKFLNLVYKVCKAIDPSRIIITNSGSFPCDSDINDVHDYQQDPEKFREDYAELKNGKITDSITRKYPGRQSYNPEKALFVSEYGGAGWAHKVGLNKGDLSKAWGYGNAVNDEKDFLDRFKGLTDVLLDNEDVFAFCYTQLYDIEQEQNGLLTYDRIFKFPPEKIKEIVSRKAVNED